MLNSILFWLVVAAVVLLIIWWLLRRHGENTPGGIATPDNLEKSKMLPPDSSGTNVHPPRAAKSAGSTSRTAAQPAKLVSSSSTRTEPKTSGKPPAAAKKTTRAPAKKAAAAKTKRAAPAKPKTTARATRTKDELQRISGIGPKIDSQLKAMKITTFAQIAAWKKADMAQVNEKLKFKGRIEREEWVAQARLLAKGKDAEFAEKYGTGGMKSASGQTKSGTRTRKS